MINGTQTIIIYNNLYLIAKRASNKKLAPNRWNFIGGRLEKDETFTIGAKREIKEEVDIDVNIDRLLELQAKEVDWGLGFFECHTYKYTLDKPIQININNEHSEYKWVTFDELFNYNIVGYSKEEILEFLK